MYVSSTVHCTSIHVVQYLNNKSSQILNTTCTYDYLSLMLFHEIFGTDDSDNCNWGKWLKRFKEISLPRYVSVLYLLNPISFISVR